MDDTAFFSPAEQHYIALAVMKLERTRGQQTGNFVSERHWNNVDI